MSDASVGSDLHESLDVKRNLSSEVTLYHVVSIDDSSDLTGVFFCQISDSDVRIDPRLREDLSGCCETDPVDVCQTVFDPLVSRQVYSGNSCPSFPPFPSSVAFPGAIQTGVP